MTETTSSPARQGFSADGIRNVRFEISKYGRGYTKQMVDAFVNDVAGYVDHLHQHLGAVEAEVQRLRQRVLDGPRGDEVIQAVNVISNAQRTADATVAEADAYSARVMTEAREAYEDARRRGAQLEEQAEERVRQLALTAQTHQEQLDKQTAYLKTLRDATRTQMQKFLEGMLFHVAEEYGRAHPMAAAAATPANGDQPREQSAPAPAADGDSGDYSTPRWVNGSVTSGAAHD